MKTIHYSDERTVLNCVVQIWDDLHNEAPGFFRAFWCADKDAETGSPVIGYCSPGGSHRTIRSVIAEVKRFYPSETNFYRNGRLIRA